MGKQLALFDAEHRRPPPSEDDRLNAKLAASSQRARVRRTGQRSVEVRCPCCGEEIVVTP